MAREINIGLIGYAFMGKAHSHGYKDVTAFYPDLKAVPVMKVICGRNEDAVKSAATQYGWQEYETSWRKVLERDDIDLVDISTPGHMHKEMAIAAAKAGKDILCEKPLANNLAEAQEMLEAVQQAGVKHMVGFNYRRVPAVALAKRLIEEGKIGEIYHFRAVYLQDWIVDPEFPLVWRLQKEKAGSGALGDLAAHSVDLARHLVGEISEVVGMSKTFIKERPLLAEVKGAGLSAEAARGRGKVTVDDAVLFLAKFHNGVLGSFEATRFASGRKNYNRFEINGSRGSLVFNLERLNELEYYSREDEGYLQGFKPVMVTEGDHKYAGAWWPPGHIIGYGETFVNQAADLLQAIAENRQPSPDFVDGVRCQAVLEAVGKSVDQGSWVKV